MPGRVMALEAEWELNLFSSDPALLERSGDAEYEAAARALVPLADARRLRLLHALTVGEDTAQRAALWSGLPQRLAELELARMVRDGLVERREGARYLPRDGHVVVQLHVALAHGRESGAERHPRLLSARRRRVVR
ncbi:MAG TPA: hypothetical protein VMJ92_05570 [Candidatus Limnocylindrales bacterium]|nr:hypothetical protein [Candidatus Limnocylindrales bacterium]